MSYINRFTRRLKGRPRSRSLAVIGSSLALIAALSGILALVTSRPASATPGHGQITVNSYNWSSNAGYGSRSPALVEDSEGVVHLEGALSQISASGGYADLLGWIEAGYAPPGRTVYTTVHTLGGTYADLAITGNGEIWLIPSTNTNPGFVSLEGISYPTFSSTGSAVEPVQINTPDWYSYTPEFNYGAASASVWEDSRFTVHLMGGVQRVSTRGANPTLIGSVPAWADPLSTVFTIVHTLGGTYADLTVSSSGQIWLQPSTNTNPGFVSLEGITYSIDPSAPWQGLGAGDTGVTAANFGNAAAPGWYEDLDGIVHLEGAFQGPEEPVPYNQFLLIGQLPVAPTSNVFTVVSTAYGTYADLVIGTDGKIWLLGFPGVGDTNATLISLDGIQFPL